MRRWILLLTPTLLLACGDDALDRALVTNLPEGDATGDWASGEYELELYTTECSGECPSIDAGFFVVETCDVGARLEDDIEVQQEDGALRIDLDVGVFSARLEGGIDEDGAFDVGGYSTQSSGDVELTGRATGTIERSGGTVTGTARARGVGSYDGTPIDCTAAYDIEGQRDD